MSGRSPIENSEITCGGPHRNDVAITKIRQRFGQWNEWRIHGLRRYGGQSRRAKIGAKPRSLGLPIGLQQQGFVRSKRRGP